MGVKVTFELPRVGRRRAIGTGVLTSTGSALWIFGAVQQSTAAAMPLHVAVGLAIPAGVGWVTVLLLERRITRDLKPSRTGKVPQRGEATARVGGGSDRVAAGPNPTGSSSHSRQARRRQPQAVQRRATRVAGLAPQGRGRPRTPAGAAASGSHPYS